MLQVKNTNINNLKRKIDDARRDLDTVWDTRGSCTDALVLAAATKLDALCNEYHRLIKDPKRLGPLTRGKQNESE